MSRHSNLQKIDRDPASLGSLDRDRQKIISGFLFSLPSFYEGDSGLPGSVLWVDDVCGARDEQLARHESETDPVALGME